MAVIQHRYFARSVSKFKRSHDNIQDICIFYHNLSVSDKKINIVAHGSLRLR